ncbi:DUF4870 domain-containing protein [Cellulomonas fimi]|uniref:DUF4870 domain-containing protein n=1 Tax=Cellulomonas fimi TaxID=1708 RepID=UPI0002E22FDE|nr:DUF4870 domain-containing protein [Cellulomonas fimi]NNH06596.1 DUF4870 domain-containing protein [Cellulomonas fimi]
MTGPTYPPTPPVPPQPPVPPYPPAGPPVTGSAAWWLGLLTLLCAPVVSNAIAAGAVLVYRSSVRARLEPTAAEVVRRAVNWQLSQLAYTVVLLLVHVVLVLVVARDEPQGFFPIGVVILLVPVLGIYGLVLSVRSAIRADRGLLTPTPGAIPFLLPR